MEIDFVTMLAFFVGYAVVFSTAIMFACLCLALAGKAIHMVTMKWIGTGENLAHLIRFNAWLKQQKPTVDDSEADNV